MQLIPLTALTNVIPLQSSPNACVTMGLPVAIFERDIRPHVRTLQAQPNLPVSLLTTVIPSLPSRSPTDTKSETTSSVQSALMALYDACQEILISIVKT